MGSYRERKGHIMELLSESAKMTRTCHIIKLLAVPEIQAAKLGFSALGILGSTQIDACVGAWWNPCLRKGLPSAVLRESLQFWGWVWEPTAPGIKERKHAELVGTLGLTVLILIRLFYLPQVHGSDSFWRLPLEWERSHF